MASLSFAAAPNVVRTGGKKVRGAAADSSARSMVRAYVAFCLDLASLAPTPLYYRTWVSAKSVVVEASKMQWLRFVSVRGDIKIDHIASNNDADPDDNTVLHGFNARWQSPIFNARS